MLPIPVFLGFPGGSDGKESDCNAGDLDSIPGLGRASGAGHDNPHQYSCLENSRDREAWRLQCISSQRARHDWATEYSTAWLLYRRVAIFFACLFYFSLRNRPVPKNFQIICKNIIWVTKSWTQLSNFHFHFVWSTLNCFHSLENFKKAYQGH